MMFLHDDILTFHSIIISPNYNNFENHEKTIHYFCHFDIVGHQ